MLLLHPQRTKAKEKKRKVRAELVVRAINGMRMIAKASLVCISVMMHAQKVMIVHTSTIWHFDWLKRAPSPWPLPTTSWRISFRRCNADERQPETVYSVFPTPFFRELFAGFFQFSFSRFSPTAFCFLFVLLLFASGLAFCFYFLLFLLLLLLFASAFALAFAFASADYLLCIDAATELDDRIFTLSFDINYTNQETKQPSAVYILFTLRGEALRPPPHPLPALATAVHRPYYFQYLYHSDRPATSLTTVTTTTIFFALTLPQRWISILA